MTYAVKDIAEYFLALGKDADEPVSNLKIQKLCYYAQGLYLALNNGKKLFNEEIQAWTHGPVCPHLYNSYKQSGSEGIMPSSDFNPEIINADVKGFLNEVYEVYGQFSSWKLRDMTHQEAPWLNAYEMGSNSAITPDSLESYFKSRLN